MAGEAGGLSLRAVFPATRPEDVFGCLGPAREAKLAEEMEARIMAEVRRQRACGDYQRHRPVSDPQRLIADREGALGLPALDQIAIRRHHSC